MPPVAAAAAGAAVSYLAGSSLAYVATAFVANVAISYTTKALQKKPAQPDFASSVQNRTLTVRSPIRPRNVIYGEARVGGDIDYLRSTNGDSYLHMVIALGGHEVAEIGDIYFDDKRVPLDANGNATGEFAGLVRVLKKLGTADQTAFAELVSESGGEWTENCKGVGVPCIYVRLIGNNDKFPGGLPNITAIVRGKKVWDPRRAAAVWTGNAALCTADYICDQKYGLGVDYATGIDETALIAAANVCDELVDLDVSGGGTSFTAAVDSDSLALGANLFLRRGDGVELSTTGALPSPLQTGVTYFWIPTSPTSGKLATSLTNALDGVAINIVTAGGGAHSVLRTKEVRYRCDGSFESNQLPKDIIPKLLGAMVGKALRIGRRWRIMAGEYRIPSITFDEKDLRAGLKVRKLVSRRENYNGVKGVFVSPENNWTAADFPAVISDTFIAQDSGIPANKDASFEFTSSASMAQRLAKIDLLRTRQSIQLTMPCKMSALRVQVGDVVMVDNARRGWAGKPFEVVGVTIDLAAMGIDLQLRETASDIYDWSTSEEQAFDPAPDSTLALATPTAFNLQAAAGVYWTMGSLLASWSTTAAEFVRWHQPEWRHADEDVWRKGARTQELALPIDDTFRQGQVFLRVRTMSIYGQETVSDQISVTIGPAPLVAKMSGLELRGDGGHADQFYGKDAKFVCREASQTLSYDIGSEPNGADDGAPDLYFKDYEWRIYETAALLTDDPVRVEHTNDPAFVYSFEKNAEDYEAFNGTPGAYRGFKLVGYLRGRQNQLSDQPAVLVVSNPAPPLPDDTVVTVDFHNLIVAHRRPAGVLDWEGIKIYVSEVDGFTPTEDDLIYRGADPLKAIPLEPETTYYVRIASYDSFGETGLTMSGQYTVTTGLIGDTYIANLSAAKILSGMLDVLTDIGVGSCIVISGDGTILVTDQQSPTPQTRVKIGDLGSGPAGFGIEIRDASGNLVVGATGLGLEVVGDAQIQDLSVDTIKIKDAAVNIVSAAQGSSDITVASTASYTTILSLSHPSEGSPGMLAGALAMRAASGTSSVEVRVTRDGTMVKTTVVDVPGSASQPSAWWDFTKPVTLSAGTRSLVIEAKRVGANNIQVMDRSFMMLEPKK